jgi:cytochrome P450
MRQTPYFVALLDAGGSSMKIDLFDPAFLADPYPTYAWLREHSPVHDLGSGYWIVSRYDDVSHVLRKPQLYSSQLGYGGMMSGGEQLPGADPSRRRDPGY